MLIHVNRLLDSLHRALWRNGVVIPERLQHRVDEHGDHHFALTIKATEAEYEPPKRRPGPGLVTWLEAPKDEPR
jgi:hypothetical protein